MRIVINGWFHDQLTTGSGQYLAALLEWLPRLGDAYEFMVVGLTTDDRRRTTDDAPRITYRASRFSLHLARFSSNLAKLWFEQIAFPWNCLRLRADAAFVPYWGSPWWRPCPVVVTIHDLIPLLLPLYRGGPLQRAYAWLVGRTAQRAAAVLTDSEASKTDIIAHLGVPAERIHAIHLAADPRYRPVTDLAELQRVRAKYSLPDEPFLLYLGGFDARKNVVRTIDAYARMIERWMMDDERRYGAGDRSPSQVQGPPAFVIAGRLPAADTAFAPDPRPVVARLGITDRVHFTGWVDEADKPALYSLALASVFVSEYEGFGLPVVEGMGSAV